MVLKWKTAEDLSLSIITSLNSAIKDCPRAGLVRSDTVMNISELGKSLEILGHENNELKSKNNLLESNNSELRAQVSLLKSKLDELYGMQYSLNIYVTIFGFYVKLIGSCLVNEKFNFEMSLINLFQLWGPYLFVNDTIYRAKVCLENVVSEVYSIPSPQISMESFNTIKLSLLANHLIFIEGKKLVFGLPNILR